MGMKEGMGLFMAGDGEVLQSQFYNLPAQIKPKVWDSSLDTC